MPAGNGCCAVLSSCMLRMAPALRSSWVMLLRCGVLIGNACLQAAATAAEDADWLPQACGWGLCLLPATPGLRRLLLSLLLLPAAASELSSCMHAVAVGSCAGAAHARSMPPCLLLHAPHKSSTSCFASTATVCLLLLILLLRSRNSHGVLKEVHGAPMQSNPWRAAVPPLLACWLAACRQHRRCRDLLRLLCCRVRRVLEHSWAAGCCCGGRGGGCARAGMRSGCRWLVQAVAVAAGAVAAAAV
jgi:hypothetical protein